jgi:flavin reductase (NADH)/flavin reductase
MQASPQGTIDPRSYRAGMRWLAGGVCIVTSSSPDGQLAGLTATAVCSVSADPPVLLVCLNRDSRSHDVIREAGVFAVNVLDVLDAALAGRFAGAVAGGERFHGASWVQLLTGAPVLASALAAFDCRIAQVVDVGTHRIVLGAVQAVRLGATGGKPLLYANGSYGGFAAWLGEPRLGPGPEEEWL